MERDYKKRPVKSIFAFSMAVCLMLFSTACGNSEVNANIEPQSASDENNGISGDDTMPATLKDSLGLDTDTWEDTFSYVNAGISYSHIIQSKISVPNTNSMPVLELEKKIITNSDKKRILEGIFDTDSIYASSEKDLPAWYTDYLLPLLEAEITKYELLKNEEEFEWTYEVEEQYQKLLEEQDTISAIKEDGQGVGIRTSDYSESMYFGDINGQHYIFSFSDSGFTCEVIDPAAFVSESLMENSELTYYAWETGTDDNRCTMSGEDLEKQAEWILDVCGLDAYKVTSTLPLHWMNYIEKDDTDISTPMPWWMTEISYDEKTEWNDGYSFVFTRQINGVAVDYTNYDYMGYQYYFNAHSEQLYYYLTYDYMPTDFGSEQEYITVQMNAKGLVSISVPCLFEVKEDLTKQTALLPFSNVKEVIQSSLEAGSYPYTFYAISGGNKVNLIYNRMDLIYVYVAGEDDEYALLPVWRLSGWDNDRIARMYCINAIDGNMIDILADMYQAFN